MHGLERAGAAIRLVAAPTRGRADVFISYAATTSRGSANVGYIRRG